VRRFPPTQHQNTREGSTLGIPPNQGASSECNIDDEMAIYSSIDEMAIYSSIDELAII
jgi:hypothetical protein